MIRTETAIASALVLGAVIGFVCGANLSNNPEPAPVSLSIPANSWPVELKTRDVDGKEIRMRFACTGEVTR